MYSNNVCNLFFYFHSYLESLGESPLTLVLMAKDIPYALVCSPFVLLSSFLPFTPDAKNTHILIE